MGFVTGATPLRLMDVSRSQLLALRGVTLDTITHGRGGLVDVLIVAGDA